MNEQAHLSDDEILRRALYEFSADAIGLYVQECTRTGKVFERKLDAIVERWAERLKVRPAVAAMVRGELDSPSSIID
jgi:hypothetical protein